MPDNKIGLLKKDLRAIKKIHIFELTDIFWPQSRVNSAHMLYKYLGELDLHQQGMLTPAASSPAP